MKSAGILILLSLFLVGLAVPSQAQSHSRRRHSTRRRGQSPAELRKDLNDLRNRKADLRKQLNDTKHQKQAVLSDIFQVDQKLDQIQDELEKTTSKLEDSKLEQARLATELSEASAKLEATRAQVRARLRHMYVHGNASFISALVGTKSVGEVASRRSLMQMIAKRDRQLFTDYQNLQSLVANRKRRQDALVVRIRGLADHEADQQSQLQDTRDEKGEVLKSLRSKQGKLQSLLAQFEADERDIADQIAAFSRRKRRPGEKELPAFHGRFERPVGGPITSGFGMRYHPILHITRLHAGIDFGVHSGTSVHAAADGVVIAAQYSTSYGNMVIIDHGGGISTVYAHCSRLSVSAGEAVHRGQTIAASGATGLAAGPHLHWEVRVNGRPVNPIGWF